MSTYQALLEQRAILETEIQTAKAEARATALTDVKRLVEEFAISAREVFGVSKARKRQPTQARYRDPSTGATWSGRGRPPSWIEGKDRAQFQIAAPTAQA
ncbi:H-NS family nucleoid-associated regulatory protein [Burkholderia pyrrocinia]|uniref:H-NS histone family protein n=1 Tax=Burkholderia pyrrocinia TaxID=60550 RepID=UPI00104AAD8B|nr:H-NS histone family protein [Burkholderia pyrrocinia]TDA49054.1 H-NS histone family protein [Burkholderia pyrrocinia]